MASPAHPSAVATFKAMKVPRRTVDELFRNRAVHIQLARDYAVERRYHQALVHFDVAILLTEYLEGVEHALFAADDHLGSPAMPV